jgi:serine/threonine protein phosphatase PrpC
MPPLPFHPAGVFSPQDAVDFAQRELCAKGNGVKQTCNRLIYEAIRERNCRDNCTVMLVTLGALGTSGGGDGGDAKGQQG